MLPKSQHSPLPGAPSQQRDLRGCYAGPPSAGNQGSLVEVTLLLCQILLPGQSLPGSVLPGSQWWAGISWQGLDPLLGDSALQLCPHPGPDKTLSTCEPWLCHSICLCHHIPPVTPSKRTQSSSSSLSSCYHLFGFLFPYPTDSLYFLPFLSTVPLLRN